MNLRILLFCSFLFSFLFSIFSSMCYETAGEWKQAVEEWKKAVEEWKQTVEEWKQTAGGWAPSESSGLHAISYSFSTLHCVTDLFLGGAGRGECMRGTLFVCMSVVLPARFVSGGVGKGYAGEPGEYCLSVHVSPSTFWSRVTEHVPFCVMLLNECIVLSFLTYLV